MAKKKKTRYREKTSAAAAENKFFYYLALCALVFLLFYPPYLRGLFFQVEQQWTMILAGFVFLFCIFWKLSKREISFLSSYFDYAVFALLLAFIISSFAAADLRLAVAEIVKMALYFIVFWVVSQLVVKKRVPQIILFTLYLSGVGVALAGFLTAVGTVNIKDGFVGGRIYSTLQYPNALAIYLAAIVVFGFYLWISSPNNRIKSLVSSGNFLLLMVFFSTNSRGGFLVFPLMLLVFLVGLPRGYRSSWAAHAVFVSALGLIASGRIIPAAMNGNPGTAWLWLAFGIALSFLVQLFGAPYLTRLKEKTSGTSSRKKLITAFIICVLALVVFAGYGFIQNSAAGPDAEEAAWYSTIVPQNLAGRLESISIEAHSAQSRIYWTLEAFDIVKENPIIGMGGGAWEASYHAFQDYQFTSTQVHNHFLQLWAEVGTLGFAIYLFIWIAFILMAVGNFKAASDAHSKILNLAVFTSAIGLGIHSLIDFDLALGAIALVLYSCFGIIRGIDKERRGHFKYAPRKKPISRTFIFGTTALALAFLLLPSSLLIAHDYAKEGVSLARSGELEEAEEHFKEAALFDPFSADYRANLASIKNAQGNPEAAVDFMKKAITRSSYEPKNYLQLARLNLKSGDIEEAAASAEKAQQLAPWVLKVHEDAAGIYVSAGLTYLQNNRLPAAEKYFTKCAELPQKLKKQVEAVPQKAKELWRTESRFLNLTPKIKLHAGKSSYFLAEFETAEEYLKQAGKDKDISQEAHLWLALTASKTGNEGAAEDHLKNVKNAELKERFSRLQELPVIRR